jgi:hypothetical protein
MNVKTQPVNIAYESVLTVRTARNINTPKSLLEHVAQLAIIWLETVNTIFSSGIETTADITLISP